MKNPGTSICRVTLARHRHSTFIDSYRRCVAFLRRAPRRLVVVASTTEDRRATPAWTTDSPTVSDNGSRLLPESARTMRPLPRHFEKNVERTGCGRARCRESGHDQPLVHGAFSPGRPHFRAKEGRPGAPASSPELKSGTGVLRAPDVLGTTPARCQRTGCGHASAVREHGFASGSSSPYDPRARAKRGRRGLFNDA